MKPKGTLEASKSLDAESGSRRKESAGEPVSPNTSHRPRVESSSGMRPRARWLSSFELAYRADVTRYIGADIAASGMCSQHSIQVSPLEFSSFPPLRFASRTCSGWRTGVDVLQSRTKNM